MSGRRLLLSLVRRRSTLQSVYACNLNRICAVSDAVHAIYQQKGAIASEFHLGAGKLLPILFDRRFLSVCSDRLPLYDEALETCNVDQQDLHLTSGDGIIKCQEGGRRRRRVKRSKSSEGVDILPIKNEEHGLDTSKVTYATEEMVLRQDAYTSKPEMSTSDSGNKKKQHQNESKEGASHLSNSNSGKASTKKEDQPKILDFSDVEQVFQVLLIPKQSGLRKHERDTLAYVFRHFHEAGWAAERALHMCYISPVLFPMAVSRFRKFFFSRCTPELKTHLLDLGPSAEGDQFLFPLFFQFCNREYCSEIERYKALVETADLTRPHTWFPCARAMKRKIIYHAGPTNSGKTHNALQRFKESSSGVYCGPLRLLAMEVYDTVNSDGVYCSLITGQEKKEVPFANHVSCTVEMVSLCKPWEVAVIDEIQLLTDEYRGWAWTRALLGVQAEEIHVCGDPSALRLVRDLCAFTGDELEEQSYQRFEPLTVDERSLEGKYSNVRPGDCIVTFSRREIFTVKRAIELCTGNRCCVIYGALPPETRTHQAKLFNDPNSGFDVLVATDAVGMGLNLSIRRVIFHTMDKYNGDVVKQVPPSQVKQIAGRAGRRGTRFKKGIVTTFLSQDIPYLLQCMQEPFVEAHSAGLFPGPDQIELFASQLPNATFSKLWDRFAETCQIDGSFFLCRNDNLKKIAGIIDKVKGLTLEDKMSFILAPVNMRDAKIVGALLSFAMAYSEKVPVHLAMVAPTGSATSDIQLLDLETRYQILSLYLWLSHHFPEEYFPQQEQAEHMAGEIALLLGESLAQSGIQVQGTPHRGSFNKKMLMVRERLLRIRTRGDRGSR